MASSPPSRVNQIHRLLTQAPDKAEAFEKDVGLGPGLVAQDGDRFLPIWGDRERRAVAAKLSIVADRPVWEAEHARPVTGRLDPGVHRLLPLVHEQGRPAD